ncbi:MAG: serine/threonine-protein kinase, partial [Planctomycetota bacterium]
MTSDSPAVLTGSSLLQDPALLLLAEVLELDRELHAEFVARAVKESRPGAGELEELLEGHYDAESQRWPQPRVGVEIDGWTLLDRIGRGGSSDVWKAQRADGVEAAIKITRPSGTFSTEFFARYGREARILASFEHPGIVRLLEAGKGKPPYLALELIDGVELFAYVTSNELDLRERVELLVQAAEAIEYSHERGVIHRDLKPDNLLVVETLAGPRVKLIDFGIACFFEGGADEFQGLTLPGEVRGPLSYVSPEQLGAFQGTPLALPTGSTDIFALGRILFELLAKEKAIPTTYAYGTAYENVVRRIVDEPPPSPLARARTSATAGEAIPRPLDLITLRATETRPDRRYATVTGFRKDLQAWLAGERISARPPAVWIRANRTLKRWRTPIAAVGIPLALLATYAVSARSGRLAAETEADKLSRTVSALEEHFSSVDTTDLARTLRSEIESQIGDEQAAAFASLDFTTAARGSFEKGYLDRAEASFKPALKEDPLVLGRILGTLANARWQLGLYESCAESAGAALALLEPRLGRLHPQVLDVLQRRTSALFGNRDFEGARA